MLILCLIIRQKVTSYINIIKCGRFHEVIFDELLKREGGEVWLLFTITTQCCTVTYYYITATKFKHTLSHTHTSKERERGGYREWEREERYLVCQKEFQMDFI
jgi:hypothetical protein